MDFCVIPPLANLPLMHYGNRYFLLGQLYLRHESYQQFVDTEMDRSKWSILDSGVGDHNDFIDSETLVELTDIIRPSEVIALDALFDAHQTIENFERFVELIDAKGLLGRVSIMFVPQGKTKEEWMHCYEYALDNPHVNTIGMSKLSIPQCFDGKWDDDQNIMQARQQCYIELLEKELLLKPLHFLGAGNPVEFLDYDHPVVRSTDSCFSVLAAINNLNWKSGQTTRIPTPKTYFTDFKLEEKQMPIFLDNIETLSEICHSDENA